MIHLLVTASLFTPIHDHWINGFQNARGEWCCGEKDCQQVEAREVEGGYRVFFSSGGVISEFVPFRETQQSKDDHFWRCHRPDGSRRCFFAPPGMM